MSPAIDSAAPWFGEVINGCDPSVLDAEYIRLNHRSGIRAFATTVCIKEGFTDTCIAIVNARDAAREANASILGSADDLGASGQTGIILALQNTSAFEGSLLLLEALAGLGIRIVQLTYNEQNLVGCGCAEMTDSGLSRFGVQVFDRLESLGIVIDLSHCGRRTARDAIDRARKPLMFSHSNCDALCPNPRNRTDDEIRAVAAAGGVIGLNAFPTFVDARNPDVTHLARHAAHISELTSPAHVSIGLDFINGRDLDWVASLGYDESAYPNLDSWPESYASGIEDVARLENLSLALEESGFSTQEVNAIFFANIARVLGSVWPASSASWPGTELSLLGDAE